MESAPFDLDLFRTRIAALAEKGVYVGTSSWKYEGWLGQIYTAERYMYRGRFATSRFEQNCLREYAETFRTVCFDGAYYTFLDERKLKDMADQVPDGFKFAFKVTDAITIKRFPNVARSGLNAGKLNSEFLNAFLFTERFLKPLESIRPKVGPIIFEFSKFHASDYAGGAEFIADLDRFFTQLPSGWLYTVELRNRKWLGPEYLSVLKKHGVVHTFNNWTDMPSVGEQVAIVGDLGVETGSVARFLLKPGRKYEEAVSKFSPYTRTQEVNEEGRASLAHLIEKGWLKQSRDGTFLYINNRLEGNALMTVLGVLEMLKFVPTTAAPSLRSVPRPGPVAQAPQLDLGI